MEITKKKEAIDIQAEFVTKASMCRHNYLWNCMHPENGGTKCSKICGYYEIT